MRAMPHTVSLPIPMRVLPQNEALDDLGNGVLVARRLAHVVALRLHVLHGVGHAGSQARVADHGPVVPIVADGDGASRVHAQLACQTQQTCALVEAGPLTGVVPGLTMAALGMSYLPES